MASIQTVSEPIRPDSPDGQKRNQRQRAVAASTARARPGQTQSDLLV